jgi:phage shock protein PspC (stress-responsive transcriptional regulator)
MAGRKRSEGFAFFAPVVGAFLMIPPFVVMFDIHIDLFGIPLIVLYLFGTWLFLIIAAFLLSRFLPQTTEQPQVERRRDSGK